MTGSRKRSCEDVFRGSPSPTWRGLRYGAALPANAQVRAASGHGQGPRQAWATPDPGCSLGLMPVFRGLGAPFDPSAAGDRSEVLTSWQDAQARAGRRGSGLGRRKLGQMAPGVFEATNTYWVTR